MTATRVYGFDNQEGPGITSQRLFKTQDEAREAFDGLFAKTHISELYSEIRMCDETGIYGLVAGTIPKDDFDLKGV